MDVPAAEEEVAATEQEAADLVAANETDVLSAGNAADASSATDATDDAAPSDAQPTDVLSASNAADDSSATDATDDAAASDAQPPHDADGATAGSAADDVVPGEAGAVAEARSSADADGAMHEDEADVQEATVAANEGAGAAVDATATACEQEGFDLLDVDAATFRTNRYVVAKAIVRSILCKLAGAVSADGMVSSAESPAVSGSEALPETEDVKISDAKRPAVSGTEALPDAEGLRVTAAQLEVLDGLLDESPAIFRVHRQAVAKEVMRFIFAKIALSEASADEAAAVEAAVRKIQSMWRQCHTGSSPADDDVEEVPALPPMESIPWLELKKGELISNPEAIMVFQGEGGFVNPVMVTGKLRTGKSYLMNALSDSQAFGVSGQARSFTQGVHICNRLVSCTTFGGPENGPKLAFADSEGQADKGKSYDIKLATPLLLVSKVIIMNEVCPTGPSKEDILRTIEIFMRAAEQVSERKKRKGLFGNLHLIMRDCASDQQECWDIIFEEENKEEADTDEQARAMEERNRIREGIFVAFETVPQVWCLPKLMTYPIPANYRDNHPAYVEKIQEIRLKMAEQLAEPKLIDNKPLTGTMIAALMPQLAEALKSDSPILNPPSMMSAVCDMEADRIAQKEWQECEKWFRNTFAKKLPLESPYFEGEMDCAKVLMANKLREVIEYLPPESQVKVFPPFEEKLGLIQDRLAALNREQLAEKATREAIERADSLQDLVDSERRRADQARQEIDNLLAAREAEKNRADMLMKQIEQSNAERQGERDRIQELEELLNKEASERESDLVAEVEKEKQKVVDAEEAMKQEEQRQKEQAEEQQRLLEEQRLEMEELQRQMDEEKEARMEAERELGMREEEIAKEDEAAELMERAAEAKKEIPLILAVKENDVVAVRGLVRHHPDALFMKDKNQRVAMHFCADVKVTETLLKFKGDPNSQDMGCWTPLHNAVTKGSFDVAQALVNASGNVLLTTRHGNTALDLAYNSPDLTVMLLSQLPELYNTLEIEQPKTDGPSQPPGQSADASRALSSGSTDEIPPRITDGVPSAKEEEEEEEEADGAQAAESAGVPISSAGGAEQDVTGDRSGSDAEVEVESVESDSQEDEGQTPAESVDEPPS